MKKILILFALIFTANLMFAGNRDIVLKTSTEAYRSYRLVNQELRDLGFVLSETKINHNYIYERKINDNLYQVYVKLYNKKIRIDVYCFNSVKKSWSGKNYGEEVMNDIYKAITYRAINNSSLPPLSLPGFWGIKRKIYE